MSKEFADRAVSLVESAFWGQHVKILIASCAFKESLTAIEACASIARGLQESGLDAELEQMPIADGGNGTLDAFLAGGGQRLKVPVLDPLQRKIEAEYGLIDDGDTAVIEMALASGLELLTAAERDPRYATTFGTGQLMADALQHGVKRIIIGLGGSATVDGGMGCLQALGLKLLDTSGQPIAFGGAGLADIATIDDSDLDARWRDVDIIIASDVENPTLGEKGAARVFGPQKGADDAMVELLENSLEHCFIQIFEHSGVDLRHVKGGGAAGAFAAGLMAFLSCEIVAGVDLVLEHNRFTDKLDGAALVITGEGKMDAQTLDGKGPLGVANQAAAHGVPTVALVGGLDIDDTELHHAGMQAAFSIVYKTDMPSDCALKDAEDLLRRAALRLGYLLQITLTAKRPV